MSPGQVLVTGAGGFLGSHVLARLRRAGLDAIAAREAFGAPLDLDTPGAAADLVRRVRPAAVVHAAAIASLAACRADPARARRVNALASGELAAAARDVGARFLLFSTDQVHDGRSAPYAEERAPSPLHAYGESKALAEELVLAACPSAAVLRLALCFGRSPSGRHSASEQVLATLRGDLHLAFFRDERRSPVAAGRVAELCLRLLERAGSGVSGVLNVGGRETLDRLAFARRVALALGHAPHGLRSAQAAQDARADERPRDLELLPGRLARLFDAGQAPLAEQIRREHGLAPDEDR